jgi:hypothetical protein
MAMGAGWQLAAGWDQQVTLTAAALNPAKPGLVVDLAEPDRQLWSPQEKVSAAIQEAETGLLREVGEG